MTTFKKTYFFIFLGLLLTEICIALFVNDAFIRPYFGDFLATICLYCFFMTFINLKPLHIALLSLLISVLIEIFQYLNWGHSTTIKSNKTLQVVLGSSFSWGDVVAYVLGFFVVIYVELKTRKNA